jgi:DsbC/DsbD-like thiol-disulfide interchange protein
MLSPRFAGSKSVSPMANNLDPSGVPRPELPHSTFLHLSPDKMKRLLLILILCLVLPVAFSACSKAEKPPGGSAAGSPFATDSPKISSESVVKAAAQEVEITAGGAGEAIVKVTVQSGYHINSNPPSYPYLKATELDMADTGGISVDYIFYPKPLIKKFAFAEKPIQVYEGETPLTVALEVARTAAKGQRSIPAKLRIQACDDQVCYAPGSIEVVIPVLIK